MPILLASASSFVMTTLVNYYLCYKLSFIRGRLHEIGRLFAVALVGLGHVLITSENDYISTG